MSTAMTLTAKGQCTFNKQLLEHLSVKPGEKILIRKLPDASLKIEAEKHRIDFMSLAGSLKTDLHLTDDALQAAIGEAYAHSGMRGLTCG